VDGLLTGDANAAVYFDGTNDVDMRARPHSDEELDFLASQVVRGAPAAGGPTRSPARARTAASIEV